MADRTSTHDVAKVGGGSGDYAESAMGSMTDLKAPQPGYIDMIQKGGYVEMGEGFGLSFDRATSDYVLRNHQLFSSRVEMGLGNIRPLIPLNVDPPLHAKYRKLLDPLFAPRKMEAQEEDITRRVNGFIDSFIDRKECNFSEEFAELLPSSVFLGLMGLPEDQLDHFIHLRDGILHPDKINPDAGLDPDVRRAVQAATGQEIYAYFGGVIADRQRAPRDDVISGFLAAEIDGDRLSTDEILDILFLFLIAGLDTVSDSLTCFLRVPGSEPRTPAPDRGGSLGHFLRRRGAAALGIAGSRRRTPGGHRGHRAPQRSAGEQGDCGRRQLRRSQRRPGRSLPTGPTCVLTARRIDTSRSAAASTAASAATWPGASSGSRCGSGTGAFRITASSQGTRTSSTRRGSGT